MAQRGYVTSVTHTCQVIEMTSGTPLASAATAGFRLIINLTHTAYTLAAHPV